MWDVGRDNEEFRINSKTNGKPLKCLRDKTELIKSEFQKDLTAA